MSNSLPGARIRYTMDMHHRIEKQAREAGPWTKADERAIAELRGLSDHIFDDPHKLYALRLLRQREINEAQRLRVKQWKSSGK